MSCSLLSNSVFCGDWQAAASRQVSAAMNLSLDTFAPGWSGDLCLILLPCDGWCKAWLFREVDSLECSPNPDRGKRLNAEAPRRREKPGPACCTPMAGSGWKQSGLVQFSASRRIAFSSHRVGERFQTDPLPSSEKRGLSLGAKGAPGTVRLNNREDLSVLPVSPRRSCGMTPRAHDFAHPGACD
jgi:hypothetical protein